MAAKFDRILGFLQSAVSTCLPLDDCDIPVFLRPFYQPERQNDDRQQLCPKAPEEGYKNPFPTLLSIIEDPRRNEQSEEKYRDFHHFPLLLQQDHFPARSR